MRKAAAFFYATLVYATMGTGVWWLFDKASVIAEEFQSTTVTLVSPEESFEEAQQQVNSEASEASKAQEQTPPEKEEPQKVEPEPEPEPTPPPEPEPSKEPNPPESPPEETPPPEPPQETLPEISETPDAPDPVEKSETPPPIKPLDPVDPHKVLDLKRCPHQRTVKPVHRRHRKRVKKKVRHHKAAAASRASARSRARRGGSMNANRLLARLKRRIARNKSYPSVARRRRMQGVVRVSFTITRSGGVRGISVSGPRIFAASARSAVQRAFPVDVRQASFALPRRMSVTLRYRLR